MNWDDYAQQSAAVIEALRTPTFQSEINAAVNYLSSCVAGNYSILVCGNGGSAADALHLTGELVGRFRRNRAPVDAICLNANVAAMTAVANDFGYAKVFARQVESHADRAGVLIAISTSGVSKSVIEAAKRARGLELCVIGLTGSGGGQLAAFCDVLLAVPSTDTPLIQQAHQVIYHHLCERVEEACR